MARIITLLAILCYFVSPAFCTGNEEVGSTEEIEQAEYKGIRKLAHKFLNPDPNKNFRLLPMPTASYDPINGLSAGLSVDVFFRMGDDTSSQLSYVSVPFYMATNGKLVSGVSANLILGKAHRLFASFRYMHSPTPFYGINRDRPLENSENFDHTYTRFQTSYMRAVLPDFYLGANYYLQKSLNIDMKEKGALYYSDAIGKTGYTMSGLGVSMQYDTRDKNTASYKGINLNFSSTFFTPFLGSDDYNTAIHFDISHYQQLGQGSHILATRFGFDLYTEDPPFTMMNSFGSAEMLRGYRSGQYLSRQRWYTQVEYRFPLFWRFRGAAFIAAGDVAQKVDYFSLTDLKVAGGGGLRFVFDEKERLSLRFDYGFAIDGSSGFYFSINEAF
jgi:hypothetical protein